ncbi:MAG: hypothetical protein H6852_06995 [Geminicoccaceae bacterium]|jgi:hypothetical protein|nr:hypothetical protein [Geminicoccaceae bacterium]HRY23217.1 hypothetical protein [Geminicoccaceae bacterium]
MPKAKDESRRRYPSEPLARAEVLQRLAPHFEFFEEVKAESANGDVMRIDAVSQCRLTGWTFGWEFKRSHLFKSEFADAMRQGIHYRLSRIADARLPTHKGLQLPAIVLFPDWLGEHDDDVTNYGREAEGMRLVGAQFRVGTMRQSGDERFAFIMGQSAIWHSASGWTKNAEGLLLGKRSLGSTRKNDR